MTCATQEINKNMTLPTYFVVVDFSPLCKILQVCAALRKMSSVLRLGVYRERIEKYGGVRSSGGAPHAGEEVLTVTLERQPGLHLGIR
jgi:hypothetical protein